ncbi:endonuclease [Sporosarcina sp. FSL W7-1283]|uniref:endonuclease n=1 Tax=Sporosarcina sp. FSL W7-1283 TaxID=2921560 RepID=UPI0030F674E9
MEGSEQLYHRICGKLLGEGSITKQGNRNSWFQFIHRIEDLGWAEYCYSQLKEVLPLTPPVYKRIIDTRLKKGFSECYTVQSRTHEVITGLYQTWYPAGKKKIPFQFLNRYLNEEALSWWYQDDGHLKVVNGKMSKVILSTDSFSTEKNIQLIALLFDKFGLHFAFGGQNRLILYNQFQITYFLKLVSPWISEAMKRKEAVELPRRPVSKRTTIYLPSTISLLKPTAEINEKLNRLDTLICHDGKIVCHASLFKLFTENCSAVSEISAYQIRIQDFQREKLASIRQQTGLTVSQLVDYCFRV